MREHFSYKTARRHLLRCLATLPFISFANGKALGAEAVKNRCVDGTFCNTNGKSISKPFFDLMKWRYEAPSVQSVSFPLARNDPQYLSANREALTLTWIGHATWLWQLNGINLITDPHFSQRASPLAFSGPKRGTPPGLALDDLPPIDAVLITHNHYDHLDAESVRALTQQHNPQFIVPLRLGATLADMGARRITELDWGQTHSIGDLQITAEPCQHWSARGLFDRNETLWASYAMVINQLRFLFIGDTGYCRDFADLGEKYKGFDLAAIPIGAYEPRWFMKEAHVDPGEAVRIFQDLRARYAVATHWGVFPLTNEPLQEPPQKLSQALARAAVKSEQFSVFKHGETRMLDFLSPAA